MEQRKLEHIIDWKKGNLEIGKTTKPTHWENTSNRKIAKNLKLNNNRILKSQSRTTGNIQAFRKTIHSTTGDTINRKLDHTEQMNNHKPGKRKLEKGNSRNHLENLKSPGNLEDGKQIHLFGTPEN